MAKKKHVNKAQFIRNTAAAHPEWKPKQIVEHAKLEGVSLTAAQVSTTLSAARKKGESKSKSNGLSLEAIRAAKAFCDKVGGVSTAKSVLDLLAEIRS